MMESIYGHGVEPCLDTPPLPLWMTEPTALHDLPFQPFYLALSAASPSPSPFIASPSSPASTSAGTPARTSVVRSTRTPRPPSPADDALSSAFWSLTHTPSPPRAAFKSAGRERWGALWDAREAQVTWDTQDSRRSLLWFETEPGSGVWVSRERPVAKRNVTRSERRREEEREKEKGQAAGSSPPRKRVRAAPQDAELAGPSRRSARNRDRSPTRLSPLGDTAEEDSQMLMLHPAASPASSLSSLPPDSAPCTPAPAPHSALNLLTTVLFDSPASSSGSSTAVSPTASERALDLGAEGEGGRARSGSTSTVVAAESDVAKGKRKHVEDEDEEADGAHLPEEDSKEEGEVRRTTRPRARTSKAQSLEAVPGRQRRRRARVRA
ncbi:hypothetical protein HWV62_27233 [Athelia sp. TMB]|nr:hypothetical protein HWV62_27233 [Athelia sp. TMB]